MTDRFSIGVLGSGPVGRGLATLTSFAGYDVALGTRRPAAAALAELPPTVEITSFEACATSDLVFLSVVHRASRELVTGLEDLLAGKILIDTDNAWLPGDQEAAGLSVALTEGRWMSQLLPRTQVVRAFSHIDWDLLVDGGVNTPGQYAAAYTVDSEEAAEGVEPIIFDMGYVPIRIGDLDSNDIDIGGRLWPGRFTPEEVAARLGRRP